MPEEIKYVKLSKAMAANSLAKFADIKGRESGELRRTVEKMFDIKCEYADVIRADYAAMRSMTVKAVEWITTPNSDIRKGFGIDQSGAIYGRSFLAIAEDMDCRNAKEFKAAIIDEFVKTHKRPPNSVRELMPSVRKSNEARRVKAGGKAAAGGAANSDKASENQDMRHAAFNFGMTGEWDEGVESITNKLRSIVNRSGFDPSLMDHLAVSELRLIAQMLDGVIKYVETNGPVVDETNSEIPAVANAVKAAAKKAAA